MIDTPNHHAEAPLSSYDVAHLHYALDQDTKSASIDALVFDVHGLPGTASPALLSTPQSSDADFDYSSRRMSSSAASDSSSRPDKRAFDYSPSASPIPKKLRADDSDNQQQWSPPDARQPELNSAESPRVQLPSIASFPDGRRASLPLPNDRNALRLPQPGANRSSGSLSSYQFPVTDTNDEKRPRLDTELALYPDYSNPNTVSSSSSYYPSPLSGGQAPPPSAATDDHQQWNQSPSTTLIRPSPTPELKYDDSIRHQSLPSLYGGVTRISGQNSDRNARSNGLIPSIKAESDWSFPNSSNNANDYNTNNMSPPSSNNVAVVSPSQRSPQQQTQPNPSSLVDRPPRKRGKLPKPVTDFLKDWLHRHSDHPYPSEEEKKQLCHATGLSMSQVSNWMINARRRILAPAHRAAQGPTTNGPYAAPLGGPRTTHPHILDTTGRRASMPADSLALYHPMSLQTLPDYATGPSTRHLVSMSRSMSSGHATVGSLSAAAHHAHHQQQQQHHGHHPYGMDSYSRPSLYGSSQSSSALHPSSGGSGGGYLSAHSMPPMSAPASMNTPNPFTSGGGGAGGYGRVSPDGHHQTTSHNTSQARYSFPSEHSVSPGPGSGYNTPH